MISFNMQVVRPPEKVVINDTYRCRDTAFAFLRAYYHRATDDIRVYIPGCTEQMVNKTITLLRTLPQYNGTVILPISRPDAFTQESQWGILTSGEEALHVFYWATLIMRASLYYPGWRKMSGLFAHMRAGEALDRGMLLAHKEAWQRVATNTDISSEELIRFGAGPVNTYRFARQQGLVW